MSARLVVDNSVVMTWCFEDEVSAYCEGVLDALNEGAALVPSIWPLEVVNVLLVAERKKRLSPQASARFLSLLRSLPIIVEQETTRAVFQEVLLIARQGGLSSYDASYLQLALMSGQPIATVDKAMKRAAKLLKVSLFSI